jgi:thiol-disulfide isomerase/thioredoxin
VTSGCGAVCLALFAGATACDAGEKDRAPLPRERSQAVLGTATVAAEARPSASVAAKLEAPPKPRKLCAEAGSAAPARRAPTAELARYAHDAELAEQPLPLPSRGTTWVNLWAAWCEPCKEEIPRLQKWEKDLLKKGYDFSLVFVSLDDDPRQLRAFLEAQPDNGVRQTFWLREGKERETWLREAGFAEEPELPVHLAISNGLVRCRVAGAVSDSDFGAVERLVAAN